jgi:hypothetical protein
MTSGLKKLAKADDATIVVKAVKDSKLRGKERSSFNLGEETIRPPARPQTLTTPGPWSRARGARLVKIEAPPKPSRLVPVQVLYGNPVTRDSTLRRSPCGAAFPFADRVPITIRSSDRRANSLVPRARGR